MNDKIFYFRAAHLMKLGTVLHGIFSQTALMFNARSSVNKTTLRWSRIGCSASIVYSDADCAFATASGGFGRVFAKFTQLDRIKSSFTAWNFILFLINEKHETKYLETTFNLAYLNFFSSKPDLCYILLHSGNFFQKSIKLFPTVAKWY